MEQSEASSLTKRVKRNEFSLGLSTLDTVVSTLKHRRDYSKTLENRQLYDVSRVCAFVKVYETWVLLF